MNALLSITGVSVRFGGSALARVGFQVPRGVPLVEQSTQRAFYIADTVCVLESGRTVRSGTAEAARAHPAMVEACLGLAR